MPIIVYNGEYNREGKEMARDIITLEINVKPWKVGRIHSVNKAGAGKHKDRRTKRNRTRADKNRNAIGESM